ncbi:MAG: hypothetical protein KF715_16275 [Candidatus Didemnitutus sp.]|nr:hypothetical protein [Candidatus Didemnitutus sp.]
MFRPTCFFAALLGLAGSALAQTTPAIQSLTALGTLGGPTSRAYAVNDAGQITGYSVDASNHQHAFIYSGGVMTDINPVAATGTSYGNSINNSGTVVGYAQVGATVTPFSYSGGTATDLTSVLGSPAYPRGINDGGMIAGGLSAAGFTFAGGSVTTLPAGSTALAINNAGVAVGSIANNNFTAVHAASFVNGVATDLGLLSGKTNSLATAVNSSGAIVGYSYTNAFDDVAFLYQNATLMSLGTLGGSHAKAQGINDAGDVVGFGSPPAGGTDHAFLYRDGTMYDLNTLAASFLVAGPVGADTVGWTSLNYAYDINNSGLIVGWGNYAVGNWTVYSRAFALQLANASPVPEPAQASLFLGLVILGLARGSRRRRTAHR